MNAHTSYMLMALLAVASTVALAPALADDHMGTIKSYPCPDCVGDGKDQAMMDASQAIPITVSTDMATYDHESTIEVSGQVAKIRAGVPVTVTVTSPMGNVVGLAQEEVDRDGSFYTEFNTAGAGWKYDGTYTIRVQYGGSSINNKAMVDLTGGIEARMPGMPAEPVECGDDELSVSDACVPYEISGGMVSGVSTGASGDMSVLQIDISAEDDGMLSVSPLISGCDQRGDPLVLVDGEQSDDYAFDGTAVEVMFPAGAESIEVVGACVVPEFGTVAVLVLIVAIVSIVAITARSRLSAVPRF